MAEIAGVLVSEWLVSSIDELQFLENSKGSADSLCDQFVPINFGGQSIVLVRRIFQINLQVMPAQIVLLAGRYVVIGRIVKKFSFSGFDRDQVELSPDLLRNQALQIVIYDQFPLVPADVDDIGFR